MMICFSVSIQKYEKYQPAQALTGFGTLSGLISLNNYFTLILNDHA